MRASSAGGPGVYRFDMSTHYDLANPEWRTDVVPEIMDGKNILDFIDADILERLDALERCVCVLSWNVFVVITQLELK